MNRENLKKILNEVKINPDIKTDQEAYLLIDKASNSLNEGIDLQKIIYQLKQDINIYSISHGFKLPASLTKLQIILNKDVNKWTGLGDTLSLTNF